MGKGDKKTKRGKITQGSYGKTRLRKSSKPASANEKPVKAKVEKAELSPKVSKPKKDVVEAKEVSIDKVREHDGDATVEKPKTTRKKKTEE